MRGNLHTAPRVLTPDQVAWAAEQIAGALGIAVLNYTCDDTAVDENARPCSCPW